MKEFTISLQVSAPDAKVAKQVADEAQALIDQFGIEIFLKAVAYVKSHPNAVQIAMSILK